MKKLIENILGFLCTASLLIACSIENPDGSCPVVQVVLLIGFAVITGLLWNGLNKAKVIDRNSNDVYSDFDESYVETEYEDTETR